MFHVTFLQDTLILSVDSLIKHRGYIMKKLTVIFLLFSYGSIAYASEAASSSDKSGKLRRTMSGDKSGIILKMIPSVCVLFDLDHAEEGSFRLEEFAQAASGSDVEDSGALALDVSSDDDCVGRTEEEMNLLDFGRNNQRPFLRALLSKDIDQRSASPQKTMPTPGPTPALSQDNSLPQSRSATAVPVSSTPLLQESVTATPLVSSPLFPIPVLPSAIVALQSPKNHKE